MGYRVITADGTKDFPEVERRNAIEYAKTLTHSSPPRRVVVMHGREIEWTNAYDKAEPTPKYVRPHLPKPADDVFVLPEGN